MTSLTTINILAASTPDAEWLTELLGPLRSDGFEWRIVETVPDTVDLSDLHDRDIIIVDTSVKSEATQSILHDLMLRNLATPVILCVESGKVDGYSGAVRRGAQDFIIKGADGLEVVHRILINALDRSQILRATQESEERVRAIIENISDGILIVDQGQTILFANPACEDLLDKPLIELLGAPFEIDIPQNRESIVEIDHTSAGSIIISLRWVPIRWEGRSVRLYTMRDISAEHAVREQLMRTRDEAERLAGLKSSFLANMSHELRMPLASIIGFAQLIEEGVENPDFKEFSRTIVESGNRLLETINSVLDLTRLDARAYQIQRQSVSIREIVEQVSNGMKPLLDEKMLPVNISVEGDDTIHADPILLDRIFNNLIGNAIKFTESGEISVSITGSEDRVRCDVSDTGIGIDNSFLPHVFDEFAQESMGRNRAYGGSGLGLAITRRLVESMSGTIGVVSRKKEGTVFSIVFPRSPHETGSPKPTRNS
jgi:PAS domain S-box-containing protein